jgi:hypothetical protein
MRPSDTDSSRGVWWHFIFFDMAFFANVQSAVTAIFVLVVVLLDGLIMPDK